MNKHNPEQLVVKIAKKIEFELKPDEKHLLTQAIEQYFQSSQSIDGTPRFRDILSPLEDLQKALQTLDKCIEKLPDYSRNLLKSKISENQSSGLLIVVKSKKHDCLLEQALESEKWISQRAEQVVKQITKLPKDKGGQKKQVARLLLTVQLMSIYEMATGKEPGSSSVYRDKDGKYQIGPFGRFLTICLRTLEPVPGPTGIAHLIKEAKKLLKELLEFRLSEMV